MNSTIPHCKNNSGEEKYFKKSPQSSVPKNDQYANQTLSAHSSSLSGKEPILNAVKTSSYI
jgi:hypothetical protein